MIKKGRSVLSEPILRLEGITKSFGDTRVLDGIHLEAGQGEFITLLWSSGCGKTTTLRIIAGLETPDEGKVLLEGQDMTGVAPNRRDVNTVFQNYALFPHMNVEQNIGYAWKIRKRPKAEIKEEVKNMLELVQLSGFEKRKPSELSGGQRQRVAIARALATDPKVLLCDEATSALDPDTTRSILSLIREINQKLGITVVVITHQMSVVEAICDRVAILDGGQVVEEGTVQEIFARPKTAAARRLVAPSGGRSSRELASFAPDDHVIRLTFNGSSTEKPLVACLAAETGILVSVLSADTRDLNQKCFGSMLLRLPRDVDEARRAVEYIRAQPGVTVEEVTGL